MSTMDKKSPRYCASASTRDSVSVGSKRVIRRYNSEQAMSTTGESSITQPGLNEVAPKRTEFSSHNPHSHSHSGSYSAEGSSPAENDYQSVFGSPAAETSSTTCLFENEDSSGVYVSDVTDYVFNSPREENKFKDAILKHVQEVAGETQDPIELDHPINKVKLELSSELGMPFVSTFGQRKQETRERAPRGNVNLKDIFRLAEENAENEAKRRCLNKNAFDRYVWEHGNRLLITGQAGIGKSTLTRIIAQKILDKEMLPETEYIFYIKCRDVEFNQKMDLFDFLVKYSASDTVQCSAKEKIRILTSIEKVSNVVILLDGMDEARTDELTKSFVSKCLPNDVVPVSDLIRCLMSGKLLPRAKVVVTCRPRQAFLFSPEYRPGAAVQIVGLNTNSQKKLGQQICGRTFSTTYNIISRDSDLESACYVTVFCMILYAVLHEATMQHSHSPLNTVTRVLLYLLDKYLRSAHMRDVAINELKKVARLARCGFTKRQWVFDQGDIANAGISQPAFQAFMFTYLDKNTKLRYRIFEGEHRCSFTHRLWQEFFTAMDLMFFATAQDFDVYQEDFLEDRWEIVTKFMYGFTNAENVKFLQRQFSPSCFQPGWEKRKRLLQTSAECCLHSSTQSCVLLVQVCNWIQEADNFSFTQGIARHIPESFQIKGPVMLFNHDVQSINRLLHAAFDFLERSPVKNLDFEQVEFAGESFRLFANGIVGFQGAIQEIRLIECGNVKSVHVARILQKVERLHIAYCNIKSSEITYLKNSYAKLPQPRPEFWVFDHNSTPSDFGYDLSNTA
ncbi:NACHT, LRR and PYD domains-containing protein 3-like isoform X1 [Clavelina lepadiformis]|uniref:NACHT, LRR and PYD domains-containing protein 3-like isoform X1 n=2 Tax=Clavelina lepadiformis TaxID=159417 RepID=UPI0040430988